jgi:hypothetical protein
MSINVIFGLRAQIFDLLLAFAQSPPKAQSD